MSRLPKKLKAAWLKALRSGRYKQGKKVLYEDGKYCCLGVLARLQGCPPKVLGNSNLSQLLAVQHGVPLYLARTQRQKLAHMNDHGYSFKEIADYIEKHY